MINVPKTKVMFRSDPNIALNNAQIENVGQNLDLGQIIKIGKGNKEIFY